MKLYTVGVLGATGAVGQEMMNLLEERNFPVGKLVPLASKRSAGKTLKFRGEDVVIQDACDSALHAPFAVTSMWLPFTTAGTLSFFGCVIVTAYSAVPQVKVTRPSRLLVVDGFSSSVTVKLSSP